MSMRLGFLFRVTYSLFHGCLLVIFFIFLALKNNGVPNPNVGIRINNEKYYTVKFDAETGSWYLKKVTQIIPIRRIKSLKSNKYPIIKRR